MKTLSVAFGLAVASALAAAPAARALDPDAVARWRSDLAVAREAILTTHPDPFRRLPAQRLDEAFDELSKRLPSLEPYEAVVGLAGIVASLGDGHTRLSLPLPGDADFVTGHSATPAPSDPELRFHTLPVRFGLYAEGLVVERAVTDQADLAGARVLEIGGRPVEEALAALEPVIRHDNRSQLLDLLPMHPAIPEVLAARGLAEGPEAVAFTFELAAGGTVRRELPALGEGTHDWVSALGATPGRAPSWRHLAEGRAPVRGAFDRLHWTERIGDGRALFVQYNASDEADGEPSIPDLARRISDELASGGIDRLILDLRWNWGGDHSRDLPLLHALIAQKERLEPGGLFVLVGRGTFSAAMMLAVELERHLHPIFVGEPTGSSPNHCGDSRKVRLPGTGLTLRISTLAWQLSRPDDARDAIRPLIAIAPSWDAIRAGRDPALEAVLAAPRPGCVAPGRRRGLLAATPYELGLTAELGPKGTAGRISIEQFASDLRLTPRPSGPGSWSAVVRETPQGDLALEGRCVGDRIVGAGRFGGRADLAFAFALEPSP